MPRLFVVAFVSLCLGVSSQAVGQERTAQERTIEAAYLLKFPVFVTWPRSAFDTAASPLVIGVLGDRAIGDILASHATQSTVMGRKVVVRRFSSMAEYRPCHILFIPKTAAMPVQTTAIARTSRTSVLIVGERSGFAMAGGVVNFYIQLGQ